MHDELFCMTTFLCKCTSRVPLQPLSPCMSEPQDNNFTELPSARLSEAAQRRVLWVIADCKWYADEPVQPSPKSQLLIVLSCMPIKLIGWSTSCQSAFCIHHYRFWVYISAKCPSREKMTRLVIVPSVCVDESTDLFHRCRALFTRSRWWHRFLDFFDVFLKREVCWTGCCSPPPIYTHGEETHLSMSERHPCVFEAQVAAPLVCSRAFWIIMHCHTLSGLMGSYWLMLETVKRHWTI